MSRKAISKKVRLQVYEKCNGHCAYCGNELKYEDMQVDHLEPVYTGRYFTERKEENNSFENLMPSCRQCNFYKGIHNIEGFRKEVSTLHERLERLFIYRLAKKFGMVVEKPMDDKFYFERI